MIPPPPAAPAPFSLSVSLGGYAFVCTGNPAEVMRAFTEFAALVSSTLAAGKETIAAAALARREGGGAH